MKIINLSYSKISCMVDCPKRFFYQYVAKVDEEPQPIQYGELGSRAHQVLENFYKYIDIESDNIEKNFNRVLAKLYHHYFQGINDVKGNMAIGVKNFCNHEIVRFNELDDKSLFMPRYSEIALEATIAGQHFRGRLDCVYTNPDGSLKLVDYKFTGKNSLGLQQEVQACVYVEMMEQKLNVYENKYYFWFLRHGMGPTGRGYEKVIDVTDDLRQKVEDIIIDSADIIEKGEYNVKSGAGDYFCCNFCSFGGRCLEERMGWIIDDEFDI